MRLRLYYADGGKHPVLGQSYLPCQKMDCNQFGRYQRYLANTLGGIAQTSDECDQVLALIAESEKNIFSEVLVEGNDVEIVLYENSAQVNITICDEWVNNPEGRFPLGEFRKAVEAWRQFLKMPRSFSSEVIVDL